MNKEVSSADIAELCKNTVELAPAFAERNVAVAVFSSLEYLPMAATVFQSIIEHANPERNYDLILVCPNLPKEEDRWRLSFMVKKYNNFSLRVVDGSSFIELLHRGLKQKDFGYNIDGECLRLFIPLVCRNYEKVVCLGADVAAATDIAEFYDVELGDHPIAAPSYHPLLNDMWHRLTEIEFKKSVPNPREYEYKDVNSWKMPDDVYVKKVLGISAYKNLFNGDVLLLHIPILNREEFTRNGLNLLFSQKWKSLTEAVFNRLLHSRCLWLPPEWNVSSSIWSGGSLNAEITEVIHEVEFKAYSKWIQQAKIFHFAGVPLNKPWKNLMAPHAEVWWDYTRETPFYEELLSILMQIEMHRETREVKKLVSEQSKMPSLKFKIKLLSILCLFTFGKTRRRLKAKRETIRKRVKAFETATQ